MRKRQITGLRAYVVSRKEAARISLAARQDYVRHQT
jgi:hypothetical protein